jgi:hypothetical protein
VSSREWYPISGTGLLPHFAAIQLDSQWRTNLDMQKVSQAEYHEGAVKRARQAAKAHELSLQMNEGPSRIKSSHACFWFWKHSSSKLPSFSNCPTIDIFTHAEKTSEDRTLPCDKSVSQEFPSAYYTYIRTSINRFRWGC